MSLLDPSPSTEKEGLVLVKPGVDLYLLLRGISVKSNYTLRYSKDYSPLLCMPEVLTINQC